MGISNAINFNVNLAFDFSNVIDAIGIIVNSVLAYWIVKTIQNKLTNKRVLKDHFISEIKDIRLEYREYFKDIYNNNIYPHEVLGWFKLMNIKVYNAMDVISTTYNIDKNKLEPYQITLRELITNSPEFNSNFRSNTLLTFGHRSRSSFERFERLNDRIFNDLIIAINDAN